MRHARLMIIAALVASCAGAGLAQPGRTVRLLTVGNSFSENATTYLPELVRAGGNTLMMGHADLAGCSLERHITHAKAAAANPNDEGGRPYSVPVDGSMKQCSLRDILTLVSPVGESCMEITGGRTKATFDTLTGALLSLTDTTTGREYRVQDAGPLFRLGLIGDTREDTTVTSAQAGKVSVTRKKDGSLSLCFSKFPTARLKVRCDIRAEADNSLRWRIAVDNGTELAIQWLEYPLLPCPVRLGESSEDDRLLLSICDGNLLEQPEVKLTPDSDTWRVYPGALSMQLTYYYDSEGGLYVATYDSEANAKRLGARRRGEVVDLTPQHLVPEIPGADYVMSYDVVTAAMDGDWQSAAMRYRDWANRQPWCSRAVAERADIPDWLKEGAFFYAVTLRPRGDTESHPNVSYYPKVVENVRSWSKALESPVVAMLMSWEKLGAWIGPDYFPPYGGDDRFRQTCDAIQQDGNRAMVYLSGLHWVLEKTIDVEAPLDTREEFAKSGECYACTNDDGSVYTEGVPDVFIGRYAVACFATPLARDMLYDPTQRLQDLGVTVVQADQIVGGGGPACYQTAHGHPAGRGPWQAERLRAIFDEVRRIFKQRNSDFVWSMEEPGEYFLQSLDCYHARNYLEQEWPRNGRGIRGVPLFTFVYHRYVTAYGGDSAPMSRRHRPMDLRSHGVNFVTGQFPAGAVWGDWAMNPKELDPGILRFLKESLKLHRGVGHPYLVLGEMMPTVPIHGPQITIRGHEDGEESHAMVYPAVVHALWRNPEGGYAYALANGGEEEAVVTLPVKSDLPQVKVSALVLRRGDGTTEELDPEEGVRLPAASAALVELRVR